MGKTKQKKPPRSNYMLPPTLPAKDRSSRQKANKDTMDLSYTSDQMDLTDIYRAFHLIAAEYTFCSSTYGTLSRIYHLWGYKTHLNRINKI